MKNRTFTVLLIFFIFLLLTSSAIAEIPYRNYTYNFWGNPTPAPQAYLPQKVINGNDLGVGSFRNPEDIFVRNNTLYILDSGNNRLIYFDRDFKLINVIDQFKNNGEMDSLNSPRGLYVDEYETIYLADTENNRILLFDYQGELINEYGVPDVDVEGVISEDFIYRPLKLVVSPLNRIYVISRDVYDGIMEFDIDGNFLGFIGAPRVNPSLDELFWSRFQTEEQRLRTRAWLPIEYRNLTIDREGLIMAVTPDGQDRVRRLNPAGENVIVSNGMHPIAGDFNYNAGDYNIQSNFVDIIARNNNVYTVLDNQRGRVFTYDSQGNLLYVFGGEGQYDGLFRNPVALEMMGNRILVLDRQANEITFFKPTDYALNIHKAIAYYDIGRYDDSTNYWQKVLRQNLNFDLAYRGMGRAHLRQNSFEDAMHYFQLGYDRDNYSIAYSHYRRELAAENFGKIIFSIFLVFVVILIYIKRRKRKLLANKILNETASTDILEVDSYSFKSISMRTIKALRYSLYAIFHPFDGFWDMKHEKKANIPAALIILILTIISYIFMRINTAFLFNTRDIFRINLWTEALSILIPFTLWCIVNWALTTLMDGKGSMKDIFVTTSYALTPIILIYIPITLVSNYLIQGEGALYYFLLSFAVIWFVFLLFFGTLTIHDYSISKNVVTTIATVVGMGMVLFLGLLFVNVIEMLTGLFNEIYREIVFRI
ncbi:YIP1 family protein [Natronospora cellulosivora (SeqCode)]